MKNSVNWYVVLKGKANGPHTEESIREQIYSGKLNSTDLAFRPGLSRWVPLSECKEFERRKAFDPSAQTAHDLEIPVEHNIQGWILLVKHATVEGRHHYIQSGPYNTEQVREKLKNGQVRYDDHVWKPGLVSWTILGGLDEFDRRRTKKF